MGKKCAINESFNIFDPNYQLSPCNTVGTYSNIKWEKTGGINEFFQIIKCPQVTILVLEYFRFQYNNI